MAKTKDTRARLKATAQAAAAEWDARAQAAQRAREDDRARKIEERFDRAAQALEAVQSPFTSPSPQLVPTPSDERRSPAEPRSPTEPGSETTPTAVQVEPGSPSEPRSAGVQGSARVAVDWVDGYLQVPNYILDRLLPLLTQDEATVYLRLYRLAQIREGGRARGWCAVGAPKLMEVTKIKRTALFAALKGLEQRGLIHREAQEILRGKGHGRGSEGNRYRVSEPDLVGRPMGEPRSHRERRSRGEPRSTGGHMKEIMKENMKSPVYQIREIGARVCEQHKGEKGYTRADLREEVKEVCATAGIEYDDALIEEALGKVGL